MFEIGDPMTQINDDSILKYKKAGQIVNDAMGNLLKKIKPKQNVLLLCKECEKYIIEQTNQVYPEIKHKGISFPVCISKNNYAGYKRNNHVEYIEESDLLKIEMGVHIDGYVAVLCHTYLVKNTKNIKDKEKKARVMKAAIESAREILKIMKPGKLNKEIVNILNESAKEFSCNLPISDSFGSIPGVLSHQVSKNIIDNYNTDEVGIIHRFILNRENPLYDCTMNELELEENEVYVIDIVFSSGTGRIEKEESTIFRKIYPYKENLKLKCSKDVIRNFKNLFPQVLENIEPRTKLGLKECLEKGILEEYPICKEKDDEYIARIKYTVIVKEEPILLCGVPNENELKKIL